MTTTATQIVGEAACVACEGTSFEVVREGAVKERTPQARTRRAKAS